MSTSDCGDTWTNNAAYCCSAQPSKNCQFWGVAYQWLIVTACLWVLAMLADYIVNLLIALLSLILTRYKRRSWLRPLKRHVASWMSQLLRWGLVWAGFVTLHMPDRVYSIFRYFLSIPFFIILLLFINAAFAALSKIVRLEAERGNRSASKANAEADKDAKRAAFSNTTVTAVDDPLAPMLYVDDEGVDHEAEGSNSQQRGTDGGNEPSLRHAIEEGLRVVKYVIFLLIIVLGLQSNDVPVVSFFQSATIFTLSIVFAAQPWIRNLIGGLMVLFDDKFAEGNYVRVVGVEGTVLDITLRTTKLQRPDKSIIYVPNSRVLEQPVTNFSRGSTRLLEVRMKLSPETPGAKIRKLLSELEHTLQTLHPALTSHPANAKHGKLGDATEFFVVLDQMFEVLIWTHTSGLDTEDKRHADIQSEIMLAVTDTMSSLGIESEAQYLARPLRGVRRRDRSRTDSSSRDDLDNNDDDSTNSGGRGGDSSRPTFRRGYRHDDDNDDDTAGDDPPERYSRRPLIRERGAGPSFSQDEYNNDDLDLGMAGYQLLADAAT
ncbi:Small-conductance mechanosensitive channel [Hondaea fermentalgiana]|uniref:Small-conductance mechanosensitive channel n=1 Tax=Hondaea fermentalgiana TaxID=2315210 RepID=A0A2R5G393_9STRA|nr:Small-conductance mechanosensitive channel [Hondaea fermentalgiana]|eukprot:GBG25507.1 Small-conductance mechanosensitive channel [Hondaea fermentalgiana]